MGLGWTLLTMVAIVLLSPVAVVILIGLELLLFVSVPFVIIWSLCHDRDSTRVSDRNYTERFYPGFTLASRRFDDRSR